MALYSTPFENTVRIVSGNAAALPDDVVILCNTSAGAVTLILQDIPINRWNVLWKLFVIDYSNNAFVNNITINAPSGQTINLGSSIVINSNGGGYVFEISGNGQYLGTPSSGGGGGGGGGVSSVSVTAPITSSGSPTAPTIGITEATGLTSGYLSATNFNAFASKGSPLAIINSANTTVTTAATSIKFDTNLTTSNVGGAVTVSASGGGTPLEIQNRSGTQITAGATSIRFNSPLSATAVGGAVTINDVDSGWVNLEGFEHQKNVTSLQRPQCRLIGNLLHFRGTAIFPLASDLAGTTFEPISNNALPYFDEPYPYVFQGTSGLITGCTIATALSGGKSIAFNNNNSVIPSSITTLGFSQPDSTNMGWKMYNRGVKTVGARGTLLTTIGKVTLDKGKLFFFPYQYLEADLTNDATSLGTGRIFTAMVSGGEVALDFTQINSDSILAPSLSATHSTSTTSPNYSGFSITKRSAASYTYQFPVTSAEANNLGGFQVELDGLIALP